MTISLLSKMILRTLAVVGVVMGLVVLYLSVRGPSSFPERQMLTSSTGAVEWVKPDRYGINFGIVGDSRIFFYARRSGDLEIVASALANPAEQPITVLVPPQPQQGLSSAPFFQVYEASSSKGALRTHAKIQRAWRADYRYGYLVVLFAFLAAGYLEYVVRRSQPNSSFKPKPLRGSA